MKNVINYYYNLFPNDIHQVNKNFIFTIDNDQYLLCPYNRDIKDIETINSIIKNFYLRNVYVHQIINNVNKELVTNINGSLYVLLKMYVQNKDNIILDDLLKFNQLSYNMNSTNYDVKQLFNLWCSNIDYFEYQINQLGVSYLLIRESFSYFVGIAETGIALLNSINNEQIKTIIAHRRIKNKSTFFDLYNPLEFIYDSQVRDITEYFKDKLLYEDISSEIIYYINYNKLSNNEAILFLARMLYPTFYFDLYERIITREIEENKIKKTIDKITDYEKVLKTVYQHLRLKYTIPEIEWLSKL